MAQYDVIFDIQQRAPDWGWALFFAIFIAFGAVVSFFRREWEGGGQFRMGIAMSIILGILGGAYFSFETIHLSELKGALHSGHVATTEGVVVHYEVGTDHNPDYFYVGPNRFTVWPRMASPAYHETIAASGPNLQGECVKIKYVGDEIVWLAVRRSGCA